MVSIQLENTPHRLSLPNEYESSSVHYAPYSVPVFADTEPNTASPDQVLVVTPPPGYYRKQKKKEQESLSSIFLRTMATGSVVFELMVIYAAMIALSVGKKKRSVDVPEFLLSKNDIKNQIFQVNDIQYNLIWIKKYLFKYSYVM